MTDRTEEGVQLDSSNVWIGPDPISSVQMLYAGTLLYFDKPLVLTLPPQVVTPESFRVLERVKAENPNWSPLLMDVLSQWQVKQKGTSEVFDLLKPLSGDAFYAIMFVYNADGAAIDRASEFIASAGWNADRLLSSIDVGNACGELVRHLFLEKYLEANGDLGFLYNYSTEIFAEQNFNKMLAGAYCLRLLALNFQKGAGTPIALTNSNLVQFLSDLPKPASYTDSEVPDFFQKDAVSLMIFNGLLSNWLDPLDSHRVDVLAELRNKRNEIDRLKGKCLRVAEEVGTGGNADELNQRVDEYITFQVLPEVRQLLEIGENAFRDYKEKLFGDRIFWTSFISTIGGLLSGPKLISAGAAVSTLASMGATAVSSYREKRESIQKSDYSLVYTIAKITRT